MARLEKLHVDANTGKPHQLRGGAADADAAFETWKANGCPPLLSFARHEHALVERPWPSTRRSTPMTADTRRGLAATETALAKVLAEEHNLDNTPGFREQVRRLAELLASFQALMAS